MKQLLLVSLGGMLGANFRYLLMLVIENFFHTGSNFSVFAINILGCFLLGLLTSVIDDPEHPLRQLGIIGFLGSFTTFSTFVALISGSLLEGRFSSALGFGLFEPIAGVAAFSIGMMMGRKFMLQPA